jgi:transcriptional regulator with XRE-family HTH domain
VRSADLIREARLRAGLTQYELAERSGRERSGIARWEQGETAPSIETLLELIRVCGFELPLELVPLDESSLARLRQKIVLTPERRVEQMLRARARLAAKENERLAFDPYAILGPLERHRVSYVVIGGFARVVHGADEITHAVDIVPSLRTQNLGHLELALGDLAATRGDGAPPTFDDPLEQTSVLTIVSEHATLGVCPEPAGTRGGYADLRRTATREPIGKGLRPSVASPPDLARMLAALGREQDRPALLQLRRLIDLERQRGLGIEC